MKKRILIKGKVHGVGYRLFLYSIAESIEIDRFYADNIMIDDKEAVEVLIEDIDNKVEDFIDIIKSKRPSKAIVESIDIYDYDQVIMRRDGYYRYITSMQSFKIAGYGSIMLEKQDQTIGKLDLIISKQDKMLEKQDQTIGKLDLIISKQDKTIEALEDIKDKQDQTLNEIKGLRQDLSAMLDVRLKKIEDDIAKIKSKIGL